MRKKIFIVCFSVFLVNGVLWAGGWNNTLMGIRAIAMGGAFAGLADDPSAVFYNPAGLTQQNEGLHFSINGFYIRPVYTFESSPGPRAESRFYTPIPQIFLSYKYSDRITLGFGAFIPYAGGGMDWKANQLGYPLKSNLGILSLSPCIAYRVSDKLSIGLSLNYYMGSHSLDANIPGSGPIKAEERGSSVSGGFSLFYRPVQRLGIGVTVRGPAKLTLSGTTSIQTSVPVIGDVELNLESDTSFNLPWDFELGISYHVSERFVVSTSAQYTMWETLDTVRKTIRGVPLEGDIVQDERMDFKNILILRAGFEYTIPAGLAIRAGIGLDRYATPAENLTVTNIDVDKLTLIMGLGYRAGNMQFNVVYISAPGREREVQKTQMGIPLVEKYNLSATIFGLGVTFYF